MQVLLSAAIVVLAAAGVLTMTGTAQAAGNQFTLFDATGTNTQSSYFEPSFSSPANWTSPVNYAGGTTYWRFQVLSKPSSLPMQPQVCMWRENFTVETCSALQATITDEGTYWFNIGSVANWWKKNNNWAMIPPQNIRIMLKDVQSGLQLQTSACGNYCYPRGDLASHVPIQINSSVVIVANGSTLSPPASWAGCPTAWSASCTTGGTTGSTTTTTAGGTTTTTTPGATTTTTVGSGTGVKVSISDGQVTEGNTGYVSLPFQVTLSKAAATAVKVNVTTSPDTATTPSDFGTRGGPISVTIPAGQTSAWVGFPVYGDTTPEPNETLFADLSSASGATIDDGQAIGTIIDNDGGVGTTTTTTATTTTTVGGGGTGVVVSIADGQVVEGNTGYVSLPFQIKLSKASSTTVTVNVTASPGTASTPSDFGTRGGPISISIPAGQTSAWVGFPVYGDTTKEANETVFATLSSPVGATIGDGSAVGTIINND